MTAPRPSRPGVLDVVLVAMLTVLMALAAVEVIFFLPLYLGSVPVPVSAVVVAGLLLVVPRLAFRLIPRVWAAALPAAVWLILTVVLALQRNSLYPLPLAVGDWRITLLFGAGTVAAAISVGLCWGDTLPRGVGADRSG